LITCALDLSAPLKASLIEALKFFIAEPLDCDNLPFSNVEHEIFKAPAPESVRHRGGEAYELAHFARNISEKS
jgi:hypothetical protein